MRTLPAIPSVISAGELPLSHGSAVVLAHLLASGSRACPVQRLTDAMSVDSALTLWVLAGAEAHEQNVTDLQSAAGWLHRQGPSCLRWADPTQMWIGPDCATMADWAAEGATLADGAARVAMAVGGDAGCSRLVGLLHAAHRWSSTSKGDSAAQLAAILPDWLRDAVRRANQLGTSPDTPPGGCVALARDPLSGATEPPVGFKWTKADRQRLAEKARRHWLADHGASDWLPDLARRLARLEELERSFDERLAAEKLEAMAELAAGAGHEMNNPLAVISGRVQLFLRDEQDPERRRELAVLNTQSLRVHEMIADMMLFARPPQPRIENVELVPLIDRLLAELSPIAKEQSIELVRGVEDASLLVAADPAQLMVALRAVCDNALRAIGRDGRIEVSARIAASINGQVEITIHDDGPGIPPEVRRHLFDPFYSGRSAGRGLGMGLAKCWRIVTNHGGSVAADSEPGRGALFTIRLPAAAVNAMST